MVGADICGFFIDIRDAEMCTRWLQVGSFYSFTSTLINKVVIVKIRN